MHTSWLSIGLVLAFTPGASPSGALPSAAACADAAAQEEREAGPQLLAYFPGSRLAWLPPGGFVYDEKRDAFHNRALACTVQMSDVSTALAGIERLLTDEVLRARGFGDLARRRARIEIDGKWHEGLWIEGTKPSAGGRRFVVRMGHFGDDGGHFSVTILYPVPLEEPAEAALKPALKTVVWHRTKTRYPNRRARFRVGALPELAPAESTTLSLLLTTSGKPGDVPPAEEWLRIEFHDRKVQRELPVFAGMRFRDFDYVADPTELSSGPVEIDGLRGWRTLGKGVHRGTGEPTPVGLFQAVIPVPDGLYLIQGRRPGGAEEHGLERFSAVVESFERRDS